MRALKALARQLILKIQLAWEWVRGKFSGDKD